MVHKQYLGISFIGEDPCSCIAHHDGKIVARYRNWCSYYIETRQVPPPVGNPIAISLWQGIAGQLPLGVSRRASSRNVLANHAHSYTIASFVDGLSVSVHALQEAEGGKTHWVKRDGRNLADRVMLPSSFAVDAARFGEISGGCSYFVIKSELYGGCGASWPSNAAVCSSTASWTIGQNSSSSSRLNGTRTPACGSRRHNLPSLQLR